MTDPLQILSSRDHKMGGSKPNQTGNTVGETNRKENRRKWTQSSLGKTSSPGRDTEEKTKKQQDKKKCNRQKIIA